MDNVTGNIKPTEEQVAALAGPRTIRSLLAADFLGYQDYIDDWITDWTQRNDINPLSLPLCVSESIICFRKIQKHYNRYVRAAVVSNDIDWIRTHYIVAYKNVWNYVRFETVLFDVFAKLWSISRCGFNLVDFVCGARRIDIWRCFVNHYGPTQCLRTALKSGWVQGAHHCLETGADILSEDFIIDCIRLDPQLFQAIALGNPPATEAAYKEFKLQRALHRIPNVALVEEYFWIHGFKDENQTEYN